MASARAREVQQLVFMCITMIAIVGLVMPLAAATSGQYYVWSYYKNDAKGCKGTLYISNPTVVSNSACANFAALLFGGSATQGYVEFMAVGWLEGKSALGDTGTTQKFYWDQIDQGVYSGQILGIAKLYTRHVCQVSYTGAINQFTAYVDGAAKKTTGFSFSVGRPSAQAESHDNQNIMSGSVSDLQYMLVARKIFRWYPWDGYGPYAGDPGTGADPPYTIDVVSNTQWYYGTYYG